MNATPRPENAPERGRRNGMQQGRTYVARTQQNADSSEQPRVGRVQLGELYPSAAIMQGQAVRARFLRWPRMKSIPVKLLSQNRV